MSTEKLLARANIDQKRTPINNDDERSLEAAVQQVHDAIALIPDEKKQAYLHAKRTCPEVMEAESNPRDFLRFCDFNPWQAADRLVKNWEWRRKIFKNRAFLPILDLNQGAMSERALQLLDRGAMVLLPVLTAHGCSVLFYDRSRYTKEQCRGGWTDDKLQLFLYMDTVMAQRESAKRNGFIGINFLYSNPGNYDTTVGRVSAQFVKEAFPCKMKAFHVFCRPQEVQGNSFLKRMFSFVRGHVLRNAGRFTKTNVHTYETMEELQQKLQDIGLMGRDNDENNNLKGLPEALGGTWSYESFYEFLEHERRKTSGCKTVPASPPIDSGSGLELLGSVAEQAETLPEDTETKYLDTTANAGTSAKSSSSSPSPGDDQNEHESHNRRNKRLQIAAQKNDSDKDCKLQSITTNDQHASSTTYSSSSNCRPMPLIQEVHLTKPAPSALQPSQSVVMEEPKRSPPQKSFPRQDKVSEQHQLPKLLTQNEQPVTNSVKNSAEQEQESGTKYPSISLMPPPQQKAVINNPTQLETVPNLKEVGPSIQQQQQQFVSNFITNPGCFFMQPPSFPNMSVNPMPPMMMTQQQDTHNPNIPPNPSPQTQEQQQSVLGFPFQFTPALNNPGNNYQFLNSNASSISPYFMTDTLRFPYDYLSLAFSSSSQQQKQQQLAEKALSETKKKEFSGMNTNTRHEVADYWRNKGLSDDGFV